MSLGDSKHPGCNGWPINGANLFLIPSVLSMKWITYVLLKMNHDLQTKITFPAEFHKFLWNKANLRDLIAATGLEILLKFDPNHPFFSPCDLEIWWITSKNNRAPCLYYIKLCASFLIHQWNWSYSPETLNSAIFCPVWPWNWTDDLEKQCGTSSMLLQALCIIS